MTLSQTFSRTSALVAAAATSAVLLFAAPQAHAGNNGPYYKVELSQPAAKPNNMVRGVFVKCEGTACRAPMATSAPKNVCISIAKEFGEVSSFTAGNRTFDATEIAACNGKTKEALAKN